MKHGQIAFLVVALLLAACRSTAPDPRTNIVRRDGGAPLVTLAAVSVEASTRDVALPALERQQWIRVESGGLVLGVREARIMPGFRAGGVHLAVVVEPRSRDALRGWTERHVDREIAIVIGAGIISQVTLRGPLEDGLVVPLEKLTRPQQLWVLEYMSGRAWTLDELDAAVAAVENGRR
jgi:hypothetical protein